MEQVIELLSPVPWQQLKFSWLFVDLFDTHDSLMIKISLNWLCFYSKKKNLIMFSFQNINFNDDLKHFAHRAEKRKTKALRPTCVE